MVAGFARDVGDDNPVDHDAAFAAGTRFRRLIASGTHTMALLLALTAAHFSKRGAMVGRQADSGPLMSRVSDEMARILGASRVE